MRVKEKDKFHYVLAENFIWSSPETPLPPETPPAADSFPSTIASIITQTGDGEKFEWYAFKDSTVPYLYEAEDTLVSPKKEYQTKFLQPLAQLFDTKESQEKWNNFTRLLADSRNVSWNITDNPIFKDAYHLSNMMLFMNAWETDSTKTVFSPELITAIKDMTKIQVSPSGLVFWKDDWSTIEISLNSEKKLEAKYTPWKVVATDPVVTKPA
jgi:hypothetical protein